MKMSHKSNFYTRSYVSRISKRKLTSIWCKNRYPRESNYKFSGANNKVVDNL